MTQNSEGNNRILSKGQNPLCLVVTKYITHQFTHILYIIQFMKSSKIQELLESNKYIKSYQQTSLNCWINIISICLSFEFQANWIFR